MQMAQSRVQEEAGVRVQAMIMNTVRERSENLTQMLESANVISDPNRGNHLDLLA